MTGMDLLPRHDRYDYIPLPERVDYSWPAGKRLAFMVTTNIEWFAFNAGLGHDPAKVNEPQTHRNYSWRDYGNRVGIWRLLELLDELQLPAGHCRTHHGAARVWWTRPGDCADYCSQLPPGIIPGSRS